MKRLRLNQLLQWVRNTRIGFLALLLFLLWAKTIFGYFVDFSLGLNDPLQYTLLILNPLGTGIILLSLGLYPKHARRGYAIGLLVYISVSYTHLRAHETVLELVCRLLLEKIKKKKKKTNSIYLNFIVH
ncbi:alkaline phosphatase [Lactobacillus rhamnosus GG] [Lacticaseibacillus rhamnosus]|nr:alkaline phosphatase [Lactobacillus rhamnosus GG] [Lacticaseibacillus rhamnosus]